MNNLLSKALDTNDIEDLRKFCIAYLDLYNRGIDDKAAFEQGYIHPAKYQNSYTSFFNDHKTDIQKLLFRIAHIDLKTCPMIPAKNNVFAVLAAGSFGIDLSGIDLHDYPIEDIPSEYVVNLFFDDPDFKKQILEPEKPAKNYKQDGWIKNLKQSEIAKKLGCSVSDVKRKMNGPWKAYIRKNESGKFDLLSGIIPTIRKQYTPAKSK